MITNRIYETQNLLSL